MFPFRLHNSCQLTSQKAFVISFFGLAGFARTPEEKPLTLELHVGTANYYCNSIALMYRERRQHDLLVRTAVQLQQ